MFAEWQSRNVKQKMIFHNGNCGARPLGCGWRSACLPCVLSAVAFHFWVCFRLWYLAIALKLCFCLMLQGQRSELCVSNPAITIRNEMERDTRGKSWISHGKVKESRSHGTVGQSRESHGKQREVKQLIKRSSIIIEQAWNSHGTKKAT